MSMRQIIALVAAFLACGALAAEPARGGPVPVHSRFKALQRDFDSGPEVTKACLTCHKEAAKQIHKTQHWKWEYVNDAGQKLGKRHVVNNFCTSTVTNLGACASCHIGYGMKDGKFDFASEENVDCLVCHDTTGKYKKPGGLAGHPVTKDMELPPGSGKIVKAIDLRSIAQRVGKTSRASCGSCHFFGGGGDGVKHGDMDSSLEAPDAALDVHMDAKGLNFSCTSCHRTVNHDVPGSRYGPMQVTLTCNNCHGAKPHESNRINKHLDKLACQACHVPAMARGGVPTKMYWDWSTAGQKAPDGKPLIKRNDAGYETYNGGKGDFVLGENVKPEYVWFNGKIRYTLPTDKIDPAKGPVYINRYEGTPNAPDSKIWPVKVFKGKQAWDPVNKTLVYTHLAGTDENAFWKYMDWSRAVTAGMASMKMPFSGQIDFVETLSVWPLTHMVAPKSRAVECDACHTEGGLMAKVPGVNPD